jgi:hypothetical protein
MSIVETAKTPWELDIPGGKGISSNDLRIAPSATGGQLEHRTRIRPRVAKGCDWRGRTCAAAEESFRRRAQEASALAGRGRDQRWRTGECKRETPRLARCLASVRVQITRHSFRNDSDAYMYSLFRHSVHIGPQCPNSSNREHHDHRKTLDCPPVA